jgi:hypothetical protein
MGNMYTTKTIQYKDRQHVSATCTPPKQQLTTKMGNMYTTKTINYNDEQHVYHQNN